MTELNIDPTDPALKPLEYPESPLQGRKALVIGIANKDSIAYGCARAFRAFGAELSITYLNDKTKRYTAQLADALDVAEALYLPCDVREPGQLEAVFEAVDKHWGKLDILLHSIAFAPRDDLHGRVVDCSKDGFLTAMDISVHSLIRMSKLAEPLMEKDGGSIFTMSYFGAEKVVPHYGIMGPMKAALETSAKYMAAELGPKGIRVNIISPGPLMTRAASGIDRFDELLEETKQKAPARMLVTAEEIGIATAALACDFSKVVTGEVLYMDGGYNILGL
ncbi:MAG: enoyl-ACP reductase FabI [Hyphomicrobiales bacterium]|nr:enoyl-ACP reductase FabI [Hyphomicrobiales bacterium]